jgi:hypothetical protein
VATGNQKSKRKRQNEYSVSPEEMKGRSKDLDERISSSCTNLDPSRGILFNISGKN